MSPVFRSPRDIVTHSDISQARKRPKTSATVSTSVEYSTKQQSVSSHSSKQPAALKRKLFKDPQRVPHGGKKHKPSVVTPQLLPLPGYDLPVPSDEGSQVSQLESNKQQLLRKIQVKRKELLLKQEIAALHAQLSGIDPATPVHSPTTATLDTTVTAGISADLHLPLPEHSRVTQAYVATQRARSRSMSPVYSDQEVVHSDSIEQYDPVHPTMSVSRSVTPARSVTPTKRHYPASVRSEHSVSSRASADTVPDVTDQEDNTIGYKIQIVRSILDLPQQTVPVQSPYTKSAPERVPKPPVSVLPRVAGFTKVFDEFRVKLKAGDGTKLIVKPPTLPRHYRPAELELQPVDQRINPSFTHIKTSYASGPVRLHDSEIRLLEKLSRETLSVNSFNDQFINAIQHLLANLREEIDDFSPQLDLINQISGLLTTVAIGSEQIVSQVGHMICALTLVRRDALIHTIKGGVSEETKHELRASNFESMDLFEEAALKKAKEETQKQAERGYAAHTRSKPMDLDSFTSIKSFRKKGNSYNKNSYNKKAQPKTTFSSYTKKTKPYISKGKQFGKQFKGKSATKGKGKQYK